MSYLYSILAGFGFLFTICLCRCYYSCYSVDENKNEHESLVLDERFIYI